MACATCHECRAAVSCCGTRLCLMDAYCSEHLLHEARWAITNRAVYNRDLPTVQALRNDVIKELEAELAEASKGYEGEPNTTIPTSHHFSSRLGPVLVPGPHSDVTPTVPSTVQTFASVQQKPVPVKKRKVEVNEPPTVTLSSTPSAVLSGPQETVHFPPEVMADDLRRKVLSLLLKALRGHLEDRFKASIDRQAEKRPRPTPTAVSSSTPLPATDSKDSDLTPLPMSAADITAIAVKIEESLFQLEGKAGDLYTARSKSVIHHIGDRSNPAVHHAVCTGELPPERLVQMSHEELGGEVLKSYQASVEDEFMRQAQLVNEDTMTDSTEPCPMCKGTRTQYNFVSNVRDIRKAEVWGSKDSSTIVSFACNSCGHKWTVET